jgi:hypothetical protein
MSARWRVWLQLAVLRLGLSPPEFWALSVGEWRALLDAAAPARGEAMSRAELEQLRAAWPDQGMKP